ncbi:MAG: hypothetical protein U0Z44_11585 [Kouleothrix sp.]
MQSNMMLLAAWARIWPILRPTLGWCCIIIGVLGVLLPVIPGMPLLFPGIALVGRRTRVIRWWAVLITRQLRRWAALRLPLIGQAGRWALLAQHQVSRQRRRLAWWYMDRRTLRP